jgi:hypothetical protein
MKTRDVFRILASETRGTLLLAVILWGTAVAAAISMIGGNPTAINAVVACSLGAAVLTGAGVGLARQDLRFNERGRSDRA